MARKPITRERLRQPDHFRFQVPLNQFHVAFLYGVLDDYWHTKGTDRRLAFVTAQEEMLERDYRAAMKDPEFGTYVHLWLMARVPEDDLRAEADRFLK